LKQTPGGVSVVTFSIGVGRKYTKQGEQPQTDFINIVAWRTTADFIAKYFRKGNAICICGSIQTRSWTDNNGNKRYATEVIADEVNFVEKKAEGNTTTDIGYSEPKASKVDADYAAAGVEWEELGEDDGLPF
jgi:single-strand DNA-binding protein